MIKTITSLKNLLKGKARTYKIEMAFLYGSWAAGVPRHNSDIDIALVFSEEDISDDESFQRITDLSFFLSTETNKEVNIIQIHHDFRKPLLYYNAVISGISIFIKDDNTFIRLKNEAIFQMEDFSIFGTGWQLEVTRKNLESLLHHA